MLVLASLIIRVWSSILNRLLPRQGSPNLNHVDIKHIARRQFLRTLLRGATTMWTATFATWRLHSTLSGKTSRWTTSAAGRGAGASWEPNCTCWKGRRMFFFYIYCHPFGHTRAQFCQGIMINRSGTYWIDYPSLCFALVAQLYHIDLASWLVQERRPSLVRSIVSYSTWCCRRCLRPVPDFSVVIPQWGP